MCNHTAVGTMDDIGNYDMALYHAGRGTGGVGYAPL